MPRVFERFEFGLRHAGRMFKKTREPSRNNPPNHFGSVQNSPSRVAGCAELRWKWTPLQHLRSEKITGTTAGTRGSNIGHGKNQSFKPGQPSRLSETQSINDIIYRPLEICRASKPVAIEVRFANDDITCHFFSDVEQRFQSLPCDEIAHRRNIKVFG